MSNAVQPKQKKKTLTEAEEAGLLRAAKAGDMEAADKLYHAFKPFLVMLASKEFSVVSVPREDLISAADEAFIRAVKSFDPKRSVRWASYLSKQVRFHLLRVRRSHLRLRSSIQQAIDRPLDTAWAHSDGVCEPVMPADDITAGRRAIVKRAYEESPAAHKPLIKLCLDGVDCRRASGKVGVGRETGRTQWKLFQERVRAMLLLPEYKEYAY